MPSPASSLRTRDKLVASAIDFLGRGESGVSIQAIASHAGVSVGSLYTHFADKSELFEAAIRRALADSTAELPLSVEDFADPGLAALAISLYALHRPELEPQLARILVEAPGSSAAAFSDYFDWIRSLIVDSVDRGFAQCDDVDSTVIIASGAYQSVLARIYYGGASLEDAERVIWQLAKLLGYSRNQYDDVLRSVARAVEIKRSEIRSTHGE